MELCDLVSKMNCQWNRWKNGRPFSGNIAYTLRLSIKTLEESWDTTCMYTLLWVCEIILACMWNKNVPTKTNLTSSLRKKKHSPRHCPLYSIVTTEDPAEPSSSVPPNQVEGSISARIQKSNGASKKLEIYNGISLLLSGKGVFGGWLFFLENRRKLIDLFEMISVIIRYWHYNSPYKVNQCFQHAKKTVVLCWLVSGIWSSSWSQADSWSHHLKEGLYLFLS